MTTLEFNILRLQEQLELMKRNYNFMRRKVCEHKLKALRQRIADCEHTLSTLERGANDDCTLLKPLAF